MTATISYDKPVTNLIDGLSATGHVTHTSHKKTMVTLHHNGGVNFSHQTILNIWKTRPASAHFDVDSAGAVAQYVKADEYAWACANQTGNQTSISIELANSTGSPGWQVSDTTWKSGARLAGWLFANVIEGHPRPTAATLVFHSHWYSTACAGPYMASIYARVLAETQAAYDAFTTNTAPQEDDMPYTPDQLAAIVRTNVKGALADIALRATPADRQAGDALRGIVAGEVGPITAAVQTLATTAGVSPADVLALVKERLAQITVDVADKGATP